MTGPHTLSGDIEAVLAKTGQLLGAPDSIYSILAKRQYASA